jgi:outer membrane protein assembly factor BamB
MKLTKIFMAGVCVLLASCSQSITGVQTLGLNWTVPYPGKVGFGAQLLEDTFVGGGANPTRSQVFDLNTKTIVGTVDGFDEITDKVVKKDNQLIFVDNAAKVSVTDLTGKVLNTFRLEKYGKANAFGTPIVFQDKLILSNSHYLNVFAISDLLKPDPTPLTSRYFRSGEFGGIDDFSWNPADQIIYVSSASEQPGEEKSTRLYALDLTGTTLWSKLVFKQSSSTEFSTRGIVEAYAGGVLIATNGLVHVFDTQGNARLAKPAPFACAGTAFLGPKASSVVNDVLYASPAGDNCNFALDLKTGQKKWDFQAPVGGTFSNKPLFLNGVIYAANPYVYALDADSGQLLAQSATKDDFLYDKIGTVHYDSKRNQLLLWGAKIYSYKPVR